MQFPQVTFQLQQDTMPSVKPRRRQQNLLADLGSSLDQKTVGCSSPGELSLHGTAPAGGGAKGNGR